MKISKLNNSILEHLPQNKPHLVETEGFSFCIVKKGEEYHAFQHKCPHAGADLCNGFLDPLGNVVCPLHHYKFNIINGVNVSGEGYFLKRYKLEKKEDGLYIHY